MKDRWAVALEKELETYLRERQRLLAEGHAGRYVVIKSEEVLGVFGALTQALEAGYERYGLDTPFLAHQVSQVEKPLYFSRNVVQARRKE